MKSIPLLSLLVALFTLPVSGFAVDFVQDIRPILSNNCFKCHGGPRAKKEFQMDRPDKFKEHIGPGKYIVPGNPSGSEIIRRISLPPGDTNRMPPPGKGQPLTQGEVNALRTWIQQGAIVGPRDQSEPPMPASPPDPAALHTWTSVQGTSLQAYFVRLDELNVILRSADGVEKPFPVNVFSDESKALIQALATAEVSE